MPSRVPIASGRACDVFEHGPEAVLRRYRAGEPCDTEREAQIMRRAEAAGVRVPGVLEVQPDALVLERIEGPTMLAEIERQPWRFRRHARDLGKLHRSVLEAGIVHMDMHPGNVILSERGPVVIDWTNAGDGDPGLDVAYTQVVLATSQADFDGWLERIGRVLRRRFVAAYLDGVGIAPSAEQLAEAARHRLEDRHMRPGEIAAVHALLDRQPSTK